jgi:outer membrane protein assembly factor BamB
MSLPSLTRNLFAAIAVALLASGCSWFSWLPWVDGDKEVKDEPAELVKFKAEVNVKKRWGASIGKGLGKKYIRAAPALLADRIIAADGYGHVEARDRFTGKRLWRARIGKPERKGFLSRRDTSFVSGATGAGEGLALIGTTHAEVVALSAADGSEQWRAQVSSEVLAPPAAGEGMVFAQTSDGRLVALGAEAGERLWAFDTQAPILTLRGSSVPVVLGGRVFTGFSSGKVTAFTAKTGEPVWEQRITIPQGRSELERIVDVDGSPLVGNAAIFAVSYQGRLKALRPPDGQVLWERDMSSYLDLAEGLGNVYVIDDKDTVWAIDQRTSDVVWEQPALYKRGLSSPVAFSNYVVVGDSEGYLHVMAQSDGRFLARRKVDGKGVRSRLVESDGILYCLGNGGKLVALEIETRN